MQKDFAIANYQGQSDDLKLSCLRLYNWAMEKQLKSVRMVIADQYYYKKTLQQRQYILSAPNINFLCKTIIFENTAYDPKFKSEFYPQYVAVMVQYVARIHTEKLTKELKLFQQNNASQRASKQYFHYRLCDEKISNELTGYQHNGVIPVLMNQKMPIVFSHKIAQLKPQFFWMGGGHPWVKMRCSLEEFKKAYDSHLFIADITYQQESATIPPDE